ncbi:MAG TPA: four helix bundle protein [Candidatus Absconditabacterales bacterium]|nr:four helix bundle protein [Candidatus Absconditabacterales bacterium]
MHNFKELSVWKKARELTKKVYILLQNLPDHEKYSLILQIQKSCISIPSNIAEGSGRGGTKEFIHFLNIAYGSAFELETQIILSHDIGYINQIEMETITESIHEIQKMIYGLIQHNKKT